MADRVYDPGSAPVTVAPEGATAPTVPGNKYMTQVTNPDGSAGTGNMVRAPQGPGDIYGVGRLVPVADMQGDMGNLYATSPREYSRVVKLMQKAGYKTDGSRSSVDWYWNLVLNDASNVQDRLDPYQFLERRASGAVAREGKSGSGGGSGSGPRAFTNTTVQYTTPTDARAIADNALKQYLGRDATEKERKAFWQQLNAAESANPQVDSGVSGAGGTSRAVRGGYSATSAGVLAEDFAKSRDDYAEYTASTKIMDWMKKSIMQDQTEGLMK